MKKLLAISILIIAVLCIAIPVAANNVTANNVTDTETPLLKDSWLGLEEAAFIAVFLGCFGRLLFPYFKKLKGEEKIAFDYKFLVTAGEAFIEGIIVVATIFPPFLAGVDPGISMLMLFLFGFNYGWGRTDINNRLLT